MYASAGVSQECGYRVGHKIIRAGLAPLQPDQFLLLAICEVTLSGRGRIVGRGRVRSRTVP